MDEIANIFSWTFIAKNHEINSMNGHHNDREMDD